MGSNAKIVDLRTLLADRFPGSPAPPHQLLITGLTPFDQRIGGGLRKGTITELISPNLSAGTASFIAAMVAAACRDRYFLALIDGSDSFDPEPLGNEVLRHLLWVRCDTTAKAMKSADLLLRDGNFPLVLIDLVFNEASEIRKIPQTSWYRLQRLVEPSSTACVVLSRSNTVSSAQLKIGLENVWTWQTFQDPKPCSFVNISIRRIHRPGDQISTRAS